MKKKSIWKYILSGSTLGFIIGILVMKLDENLPEFFGYVAFPVAYLIPSARHCSEIACAFYYEFSLIIGYAILGILIGILFYWYLNTKNDN